MIEQQAWQLLDIHETPSGVAVKIRVQPRASRNAISGLNGDRLKISLTAPPVEGEANEACIAFLATVLAVAKSRISISSGIKGRNKVVTIHGLTKAAFLNAVATFCERKP